MKDEYCPKTYFLNEKEAQNYLDILKKTSNRDKIPRRAYLCPKCLTWHLTSKERDIDTIQLLRQKNNELRKLLSEKDQIINQLKKKS
jgi:hypothetical protein